jgi:hypothetical protein
LLLPLLLLAELRQLALLLLQLPALLQLVHAPLLTQLLPLPLQLPAVHAELQPQLRHWLLELHLLLLVALLQWHTQQLLQLCLQRSLPQDEHALLLQWLLLLLLPMWLS